MFRVCSEYVPADHWKLTWDNIWVKIRLTLIVALPPILTPLRIISSQILHFLPCRMAGTVKATLVKMLQVLIIIAFVFYHILHYFSAGHNCIPGEVFHWTSDHSQIVLVGEMANFGFRCNTNLHPNIHATLILSNLHPNICTTQAWLFGRGDCSIDCASFFSHERITHNLRSVIN